MDQQGLDVRFVPKADILRCGRSDVIRLPRQRSRVASRLLNGDVSWLGSTKYFVHVVRRALKQCGDTCPISYETSGDRELAVAGWQPCIQGQFGD